MVGKTAVLSHVLRDAMARHGCAGRIAILDSSGSTNYATLARKIDCYAGSIREWTIGPGTLIGILAPRSAKAVAAFFGAIQAGACPSFIEPRLAVDVLAARMSAIGMRHLIVEHPVREVLTSLSRHGAYLHPLAELENGRPFCDENLRPEDSAMILFTSGSSGQPKGVLLSQSNLACNADGIIRHTDIGPDDCLLHVMPLHHTNGVNNQLIAPFLVGARVALIDRFRPEKIVEQLHNYTPTYVTGVPTMYSRVLPHL